MGYREKNKGYSSQLPQSNCNISMPSVREPLEQNHICSNCGKEDVCMYKAECTRSVNEIIEISERANVFINVDIRCKKWIGRITNIR